MATTWRCGRERAARCSLLAFTLMASAGTLEAQPPATTTPPAQRALTDVQKERFLLQARILSRHGVRQGIGTERAILALDGIEHEALVQEIDEYDLKVQPTDDSEIGLRDNWRSNVAAYRLDRLLGLGMVPVTVERRDELKEASFTWWVDDILIDGTSRLKTKVASPEAEAWNRQMDAARIFDQLIHNVSRSAGTLLVDKDWRVWMIGHSRAFKVAQKLKSPRSLGARCPRGLLAGLRRLDKPAIEQSMVGLLDRPQIDGLLARRDAIVDYFEERIASSGEDAVLYDLPARP
jgi:hypothetical protein